jgi:hypothetical protein
MEAKPCSRCSRPADFSLALLVSTLRIRPRGQKCSHAVLLCRSCIHDVSNALALTPASDLHHALSGAYTALRTHFTTAADGSSVEQHSEPSASQKAPFNTAESSMEKHAL